MSYTSIPAAFRACAEKYPTSPAVRWAGRVLRFAEIDRASSHVAGGLASEGIGPGDRVALYCINGPEFAIAYLAVLKTGATVVPVNLPLSPPEVHFILKDAEVRGAIYDRALADAFQAARQGLDSLELAIVIGAQGAPTGDFDFQSWAETEREIDTPAIDPIEDVAAVLYTSGTTGHPKGAQLTHRNLLANTASIFRTLELAPGRDVILVVLPMFHSFAATVGMLTPLLYGLAFAPVPKFEPGLVVDSIEAVGATVFLGVPSMYSTLLKLPDSQVQRWRSVRFCISGGSALPVALLNGFENRFGIPLLEGDGPTECSPVTCVNPLEGVRKPGSVGLPIADVEMRILDGQGEALPVGEMGEVCVRGPNVMKGYLNRPEANANSFFNDWFRTGDLGYRDADGYFFLVDRRQDMIIVNGMNVYPRAVEQALSEHPAVADVAVVGEPHELHGEIPVAFLVLREGAAEDLAEIRSWCRERLGRHEIPRKFWIRDALPRNAAGKVMKRELRNSGEIERGVDSRVPGSDS